MIQYGAWHDSLFFSLSPSRHAIFMSISRFVAYGVFFFGFIITLNSKKRINIAIIFILLLGLFSGLYGFIQTYLHYDKIWWFSKIYYKGYITGTFINRNHFAFFMAILMVLSISYFGIISSKRGGSVSIRKVSFRAKVLSFASIEQDVSKKILLAFGCVLLGVFLIFSASRGGIVAAGGGVLAVGVYSLFAKTHRRQGFVIIGVFLVMLFYAYHIGLESPVERFEEIQSSLEVRSRYAQKAMELVHDFPLAGVGVGNFQHAYPRYQAVEDSRAYIRYAHNDWAQFLAEAGVVGFVLLLAGVAVIVFGILRDWRRRHDPHAVGLGFLPVAVLVVMGVHSFFDFNLHIPANVLVMLAIMAIGCAALRLNWRRGHGWIGHARAIPLASLRGALFLIFTVGMLVVTGTWTVRHFMGEIYCNTVPNSTLNRDPNPPLEEIRKAIAWDSGNAAYWYKMGLELMRLRDEGVKSGTVSPEGLESMGQEIVEAFEGAVKRNPLVAQYFILLGWSYAGLWARPDYHDTWLPAADTSMERAAYLSGVQDPREHVEMGHYWTMRSKTIYPSEQAHHAAWARARWHYMKAQSLEQGSRLKEMRNEIRQYVWNHYPDEELVREVLEGE